MLVGKSVRLEQMHDGRRRRVRRTECLLKTCVLILRSRILWMAWRGRAAREIHSVDL